MELNREIFDIDDEEPSAAPALPEIEVLEAPEAEESKKDNDEEEIIQVLEDVHNSITPKDDLKELSEPIDDHEVKTKNAKQSKKRFDSVRNLLEKVRQKLNNTKQFWRSRSRSSNSRAQSQGPPSASPALTLEPAKPEKEIRPSSATSGGNASQSSPNTPAQLRKEKRTRSFSPVRSFLNSPLIRRRKKNSMDSSTSGGNATAAADKTDILDENNVGALSKLLVDSDSEDENLGAGGSTSGGNGPTGNQNKEFNYHNLETFQKKKLKQKLKSLTTASSSGSTSTSTTGPYPSPPPAPQRVPHPPRKNLQHASGLLQPSTPLLPRRALNKFGGHPGATPNCTPNPTPNVKRRGINALIQQYQQQNQVTKLRNQMIPT